jgi:hypothetical protein
MFSSPTPDSAVLDIAVVELKVVVRVCSMNRGDVDNVYQAKLDLSPNRYDGIFRTLAFKNLHRCKLFILSSSVTNSGVLDTVVRDLKVSPRGCIP